MNLLIVSIFRSPKFRDNTYILESTWKYHMQVILEQVVEAANEGQYIGHYPVPVDGE
jgi:hypothetical protein